LQMEQHTLVLNRILLGNHTCYYSTASNKWVCRLYLLLAAEVCASSSCVISRSVQKSFDHTTYLPEYKTRLLIELMIWKTLRHLVIVNIVKHVLTGIFLKTKYSKMQGGEAWILYLGKYSILERGWTVHQVISLTPTLQATPISSSLAQSSLV
jgi:hypothetical protein